MRRLHHFALSPSCRKIRLVLGEKKLACEYVADRPVELRARLAAFDPTGLGPLLVEDSGESLSDGGAIAEYLDEIHPDPPLLPARPIERAEVRRLVAWFDHTFFAEVSGVLLRGKVLKRLGWVDEASAAPDLSAIRAGLESLRRHAAYVARLGEQRGWLAGTLSLADLTAAAHFSCVDYLGDLTWEEFPGAREWYARVKSRPCFRPILADNLPGTPPPRHYANLDF